MLGALAWAMVLPHGRSYSRRACHPSSQAERTWALNVALRSAKYSQSGSTPALSDHASAGVAVPNRDRDGGMLALSFCCLQRWHALGTLFLGRDPAGGDVGAAGGCESAVYGPIILKREGQ